MAANKTLERGSPLQISVPAAADVDSGELLFLGNLACVANESDGDATRPSTGKVSVDTEGAFALSVVAKTSISPGTGSAVNPGDKLYLEAGTSDTDTGVTYGGTINKNSAGKFIGIAVSKTGAIGPLIASGSTGTIDVLLNLGA